MNFFYMNTDGRNVLCTHGQGLRQGWGQVKYLLVLVLGTWYLMQNLDCLVLTCT